MNDTIAPATAGASPQTRHELVVPSPVGPLLLIADDAALLGVRFADDGAATRRVPARLGSPLDLATTQLDEYFTGRRTAFDLPLKLQGASFELAVWRRLLDIPYGDTLTYGRLAAACGSRGAARAAGAACRRNPLAIVVPCHRVVGAGGSLTGYAGGLAAKAALLRLEVGT